MAIPTLDDVRREFARRDYARYVEYVHRGAWIPAKHVNYICDHVERFISDQLHTAHGSVANILILSMPPQHGKSQTVTETLPSWYLGKKPDKRVIAVSYGDDLARRFGRRNKQKITEFGDIFDIELATDSRSDTEFEIKGHTGSMISRGIMAGITGNPGDLIIIDDPIKNRQEAESEAYRSRVWEEWLNSIKTRLSATGKVIVIMTRWHEDDLAGRLIKQGKEGTEQVFTINLPCEAEAGDPLDREKGEALFPEIGKDNDWLARFKVSYQTKEGNRSWNALYQGRPSAADGGMFKRTYFRYFKEHEGTFTLYTPDAVKHIPFDLCQWFQTVDTAMKTGSANDYTVIGTWIVTPDKDMLLYDVFRDRVEVPDQWPLLQRMRQRFPYILFQAVEDKASGIGLIQTAAQQGQSLHILKADTDKITRAFKISIAYENGKVYHKEDANWLDDYENEILKFPNGAHDDQVDMASYAGIVGEHFGKPWPKEEESVIQRHKQSLIKRNQNYSRRML